jgi:hypothetical protein
MDNNKNMLNASFGKTSTSRKLSLFWLCSTAHTTEFKPGSCPPEPLLHSNIHDTYHNVGPAERTKEHTTLQMEMGYSYDHTLYG